MRLTLWVLLALGLSSCAYVEKQQLPKTFVVERQWARHTLEKEHYGFRHSHSMTPVVTEKWVLQGDSIHGLSLFDRQSDHVQWTKAFKGGISGGAQIVGETVYVGAGDGFFYSLKLASAQVNWSFPIRFESLGAPLVKKDRLYFLAGNNVAYALDATTGKQLWVYNRQDSSSISIRGGSRPTLKGNSLFIGFSDGSLVALNKDSGTLLWEKSLNNNRRFRDVDAEPILDGDRLYISSFDDGVYCLDAKTGRIIWRSDDGGSSAVTLYKNKVFFASSTGHVVAADKGSGKTLWKISVRKGIASRPKVYRGLLAFGESGGAFRVVNTQDGQTVGRYETGRGVSSSAFIDGETGEAYFMTVNADLYSVRMAWKSPLEIWPWDVKQ